MAELVTGKLHKLQESFQKFHKLQANFHGSHHALDYCLCIHMAKCDPVVIVVLRCGINEAKWDSPFLSSLLLYCSLSRGWHLGVEVVSVIFDFACR